MATHFWVVKPQYYDCWKLALCPRAPKKGLLCGLGEDWVRRLNSLGVCFGEDSLVVNGLIALKTGDVKKAVTLAEQLNAGAVRLGVTPLESMPIPGALKQMMLPFLGVEGVEFDAKEWNGQ